MPATPFFSAFGSLLFGRAPRSAAHSLRARFHQLSSLSEIQEAFGSFIPHKLLSAHCSGTNSRDRIFSSRVTFWAFLAQVLSPGCPCRESVRKIQAWWQLRSPRLAASMSPDTSAYCQARGRLAQSTLEQIHGSLTDRLERNVARPDLWQGREVYMVDGTNLSMPDTPQNQAAYPQPSSQKPGCGFPMMKIVAIFSLASGALLHIARGTLHVHESVLFCQLWKQLKAGSIILSDRGFCSFFAIASLAGQGVDCVMRLHHSRSLDGRRGLRLGPGDRLVIWRKPAQRSKTWPKNDFDLLPQTIALRQIRYSIHIPGFRTQQVALVTTLLDPIAYPAAALAELYLLRWTTELHFREIKTILRLDVLRCLTPKMIHKEVCLHLIAYNMVRVLMQQASHIHNTPLRRLSFKGTLDTLRHWADVIHAAQNQSRKQASLLCAMLAIIAKDQLPLRPNRVEPRARKRRAKNYHLLTKPRRQMHVPKHRNRPAPIHPKPALS
jgi:DDE family transposase